MSYQIIGTCQKCAGPVACDTSRIWMTGELPVPMCYGCGAVAKEYGRVLGMGEPAWPPGDPRRQELPLPMRVARGEAEWPKTGSK